MSSPQFSSGIVEWAKHKHAWKSPHEKQEKGEIRRDQRAFSCFSRGVIFTRTRSTIPEEKWGLLLV